MRIQINNKSKINNPTEFIPNNDPDYISSFEGDFNESFFKDPNSEYEQYLKHQVKNLNNLTDYLNTLNLQLEYIWLIVFRNEVGRVSTSYVIKTNTNNQGLKIFWRKYLSRSAGSGQNDVFIVRDEEFVDEGCVSNIKVQLTSFLENPDIWIQSV